MNKLALALAVTALISGCGAAPSPVLLPARVGTLHAAAKKPTGDYLKARQWMVANSGGSYWDRPRKHLFPSPDDGEGGTRAQAYGDADGRFVADFLQGWVGAGYAKLAGHPYNPATDIFVAVETTDDEPVFMVALFDRQAGKGHMITTVEWVDIGTTMPQAAFHKLFPTMGDVKDVDYARVSDAMFDRGVGI